MGDNAATPLPQTPGSPGAAPLPGGVTPEIFGAPIEVGDRQVRLARPDELPQVLALRGRAFRHGGEDHDDFDDESLHLWVGRPGGPPLATLRLRWHGDAESLLAGYAARFYDLSAMAAAPGASIELGRLCTEHHTGDGNLLRLAWAGVARLALNTGAARLIGCTSFRSTEPETLDPAWAVLAARFQGPPTLAPGRKAPETYGFDAVAALATPEGTEMLPPLLRAYLSMGGWVSDHAVVDRDLGTCHVFTCVEVDAMPPARKRALSALASRG